ncbi:hypothetical protein BGZ60DRAFT_502447 [Tricladium varicosporioides]|nr:hypothetical protein BGZ60DRAFT_502447 [Hymenoscyphus varicosporioides]
MGSIPSPHPVRIMNISGSPCDKRDAIAKAAAMDEHIDVLVGDWMSELNMPTRAYNVTNGTGIGYEESFLEALEPALENIAKKGIKLACNAGTVATQDLYDMVVKLGDAVLDLVKDDLRAHPEKFIHISTGQTLEEWDFDPLFAQCYLGGMGIAAAFSAGADIVLCGRVADASPIIGAAAWWHGWSRTDYDELARALIAGHLIECSVYVTGGNFNGFKTLDWESITNIGYPIAEISADGDVVMTKVEGTGGLVSQETCKEQLLYEIQGMYYLNCDVTAVINQALFTELAPNRVRLSGITGLPPPATTKMGLTALGGYQAELHWAMIGLDIPERMKLLEKQLKEHFGKERLSRFSTWDLSVYGSAPVNPRCQNECIVDVRLFAQAREREALEEGNFLRPALDINMHTYPSATFHADLRTAVPKVYTEYFPTLIPQPTQTIYFSDSREAIKLLPPTNTIPHPHSQPSYPPTNPVPLSTFSPTQRMELGRVVYARAGDKGSNCNVGLFARSSSEWPWLRSFLTTERLIELMGEEYKGGKVDRMEFENLWAVHFLLHDHLDRGVTANRGYDILGKFLAEFLRMRVVDVPVSFVENGELL